MRKRRAPPEWQCENPQIKVNHLCLLASAMRHSGRLVRNACKPPLKRSWKVSIIRARVKGVLAEHHDEARG